MIKQLIPLFVVLAFAILLLLVVPSKGAERYPLCVKGAYSANPEGVTANMRGNNP